MDIFVMINVQSLLIFITLPLFIYYNWKKRWLYYYTFKAPGTFSLPFFKTSFYLIRDVLFLGRTDDIYNIINKSLIDRKITKPIVKYWFLDTVYFFILRPQDIETVLKNCLEKDIFYHFSDELMEDTLLSLAPVQRWKKIRRVTIKPFGANAIRSFVDIFAKYGNKLVQDLDSCAQPVDIIHKMWLSNIQMTCETLANVDASLIQGHEQYIESILGGEKTRVARAANPLLYLQFFWKRCSLRKEALKHNTIRNNYMTNIFTVMDEHSLNDDSTSDCLIRILRESYKKESLSDDELLKQANFMFSAASETTSVTMGFVLFLLGLNPDIQDKVFDELFLVFGNDTRNPNLEDISQLQYLERVVKETMRLFPAAPLVSRSINRNVKIDSCVLPAGANIVVPIGFLHRKEELWPNPLKFDPDRFLPERIAKMHKCSFIPFSYGPRNCLGYRYAMVSMTVILSTLLRNYKVKTSNYKSVQEVDFSYDILAKPKKGLFIKLEKRNL